MAINKWLGRAAGIARVVKVVPSAPEVGDVFGLSLHGEDVIATATAATVHDAVEALRAAIVAKTTGPWSKLVAAAHASAIDSTVSDYLTVTGEDDGTPFTLTPTTTNVATFDVTVIPLQEGVATVNQKLRVSVPSGAGGNFTLTFEGQTTTNIAVASSALAVSNALEGLSNIAPGDVVVSKNSDWDWTIEFAATYAGKRVTMTGNGANLTGAASVAVTTVAEGRPANYARGPVLSLTVDADVDQFRFKFTGGDAYTGLAYYSQWVSNGTAGATAEDIRTALHSIRTPAILVSDTGTADPPLADTQTYLAVDVVGPTGGPWTITVRDGIAAVAASDALSIGDVIYKTPGAPEAASSDVSLAVVSAASTAAINEVQQVALLRGPTGGTFTLSFQGQTTAAIAYNATNYDVRDKLCDLSNIAGTDEVQTVTPTGVWTGGTFTLGIDTGNGVYPPGTNIQFTGNIAWNADAATVQAAINAIVGPPTMEADSVVVTGGPLPGAAITLTYRKRLGRHNVAVAQLNPGNLTGTTPNATIATTTAGVAADVTVTGAGTLFDPWVITFIQTFAGANVGAITGSGTNLTGANVTVEVVRDVVIGRNEIQQVAMFGRPTGGTFTLTFNAETTTTIAYNATAATVQAAIEGLTTPVPGDVIVTGGPLPTNPVNVEFTGAYAKTNVATMTSDPALLTGANTQNLTVTTLTAGTGPHHATDPDNWSLAHQPADGEDLVFADTDNSMLYDIDQFSTVTPASITVAASFEGTIGLPPEHEDGSTETLPLYWRIGDNADATTIEVVIGRGDGNGSSLLAFDFGNCPYNLTVDRSGSVSGALPAVRIKGGHANATANVNRGSVGFACYSGDTATLATLRMAYIQDQPTDANVLVAAGTTIAAITKYGGILQLHVGPSSSFEQVAGVTTFYGTSAIVDPRIRGGSLFYASTGNLNGVCVLSGDAQLNFDVDPRAKTVAAAIEVYGDTAEVIDKFKVATTSGESPAGLLIDYNETTRQPNLGSNYRLKRMAVA